MNDEAHIRFVDSHTKGDGGYDNINFLHQKVVLRLRAQCGFQSCMVRCGLDVVSLQNLSQFLHLLTRQTIDNTTLTRMLLDKLDNILVDVLRFGAYLVIEIRAIE